MCNEHVDYVEKETSRPHVNSQLKMLTRGSKWRTEANVAGFFTHQWPLLLTWFNFNPSMDK